MFSALTITSTKQGFAFDAAASAGAFAVIEKIAGFAAAVLKMARRIDLRFASLRPAQA